jgi:CRP-like cAMP-binding protein
MSLSNNDVFQELRRAPLFAELEPAQLESLRPTLSEVDLAVGDILFNQGEPAERFFLVRQGQIKLARVSADGAEKIIEIIQPGQTFAEAMLFMGAKGRYPVNAQALAPTHLLAFEQKAFLQLLRTSPDLSFAMLRSLSLRLHGLVNQIESLTLKNATDRLVIYLLDQAPSNMRTPSEITLTIPKGAIASRLAIQPETFSRILGRLRNGGLIEVQGNHIVLRDVAALRAMVDLPER